MKRVILDSNTYYHLIGVENSSGHDNYSLEILSDISKKYLLCITTVTLTEAICKYGKREKDFERLKKCLLPLKSNFTLLYNWDLPLENDIIEALLNASCLDDVDKEINQVFENRISFEARHGTMICITILITYSHALIYEYFNTQDQIDTATESFFLILDQRYNDILSIFEQESRAEGDEIQGSSFRDATRQAFNLIFQDWIQSCVENECLPTSAIGNTYGQAFADFSEKNIDDLRRISRKRTFDDANKLILPAIKDSFIAMLVDMRENLPDDQKSNFPEENPLPTLVDSWMHRLKSFIGDGAMFEKNDMLDNLIAGFLDMPINRSMGYGIITEDNDLRCFLSNYHKNDGNVYFKN